MPEQQNIENKGELKIGASQIIIYNSDDGKNYNVTFYSLDLILAVGFRVRSKRGTQFRQWASNGNKINKKGVTLQ